MHELLKDFWLYGSGLFLGIAWLVPAVISGISALSNYLGNRKKTVTQDQSFNNTFDNTGTNSFSSMPNYDPMQLAMRNYLSSTLLNRARGGDVDELVNNYVGGGIRNINESAGPNQMALSNILAARGLSHSPVAGNALANQETARIGQIANLRGQAPLLRNDIQRQRLTDFATFFSSLPTGTTGTATSHNFGTSSGTGTASSTDPGNPWAGGLAGLGNALAFFFGQGAFGGQKRTGGSTFPGS